MRIDIKDPKHWYLLIVSGLAILCSIPFRWIRPRHKEKKTLVFYDQLNGNSKAFLDYLGDYQEEYEMYFVALPKYLDAFPAEYSYVSALSPLRLRDMIKVAQSDVCITNFGLQTMLLFLYLTNIAFVDVWHGISYKGFDEKDFFFLKKYAEVWVSSEGTKDYYVRKFGVPEEIVMPTGYARTDALVKGGRDAAALRKKYGIEGRYEHVVLFAPTWRKKDDANGIVPFGESEKSFLRRLNDAAEKTNSLVIFRAHRESGDGVSADETSHVRFMPSTRYPDTEEMLLFSDMVVTDWSSIAFDFLVTRRPTLFLDVPMSTDKGFTLGPEHRFGEVVGSVDELVLATETYVSRPDLFEERYGQAMDKTHAVAYGPYADGKAAERYQKQLRDLLGAGSENR